MKVSVIIPVYKVENFVERCIRSIINQTFTEGVECIVVNDCTPDRSMAIVEEMVKEYTGAIQFRLINHECNRGIAVVRNTGLAAAEGDYLIYIDSDDYCEPDMLEKMYGKACEESADIVVADYWEEYKDKAIYRSQEVADQNIKCVRNLLNGKLAASNWNKLVRRDLLIEHGITYIENINYGEDYLVSLQLFYYAAKVIYIPQAFLHYIQYNNSSCTFLPSKKSLEDIMRGEKIIIDFLERKNMKTDLISELIGRRLLNWCMVLSFSKGKLQRKWNRRYKDITVGQVIKYGSVLFRFYWRIGLLFAAAGILPAFNGIRRSWLWSKRFSGKKIILYDE